MIILLYDLMDLIVLFVVDRKNSGLATHGIHPLRKNYIHCTRIARKLQAKQTGFAQFA